MKPETERERGGRDRGAGRRGRCKQSERASHRGREGGRYCDMRILML